MPLEILGWLTCSCFCSYTWAGMTEQRCQVHGREKLLGYSNRGKGLEWEGPLLYLWTSVKDSLFPRAQGPT